MDASQYKDYVLVLLFMKYVSDKGGDLVDIPEGGSFYGMVKLKGQPDIGDKWLHSIRQRLPTEMDNISHRLTQRIKGLAERYETPLPLLNQQVEVLAAKVDAHLRNMGLVW